MPVSAPCALLCKWVNAVCLRAGLDFSEFNAGPRGRQGRPILPFSASGFAGSHTVRDGTSPVPIVQSNREEMPGWSERVPIETQFIRIDESSFTLEKLLTKCDRKSTSPAIRVQAAKWFM